MYTNNNFFNHSPHWMIILKIFAMQVSLYSPLPLTHCLLFWWSGGWVVLHPGAASQFVGIIVRWKCGTPVQILWRISKWQQQGIKPSWIPSKSGALCEFTGRMPVKQPCLQPSHWLFQMASSGCPGPLVSSWVQSMRGSSVGYLSFNLIF